MPTPKLKVIQYVRDFNVSQDKFQQLDRMLADVKAKKLFADAVLVQAPEVLGDDYNELVSNLTLIADAGLAVAIVPQNARGHLN